MAKEGGPLAEGEVVKYSLRLLPSASLMYPLLLPEPYGIGGGKGGTVGPEDGDGCGMPDLGGGCGGPPLLG